MPKSRPLPKSEAKPGQALSGPPWDPRPGSSGDDTWIDPGPADFQSFEGLADPSRPPLVGRRFGHVRIDSLIDRGGMGEVYRGFDEALERRVAVKAIRPEQRPQQQAQDRFHREARLLSKLEHPNVCRIYDFYRGDEETGDLLILEYVEGRKLGEVLKRGLRFEQKLRIAEEIASALEAAHELRIIHRDLKPGNVMIKGSGRVKVLDFGLARSLDQSKDPPSSPSFPSGGGDLDTGGSSDDPQTNHQFIIGTLAFMSPEQAVGEPLTEASDQFSFGLLLQWLFTETSPYGGESSRLDLLRRVLQGDTLPARTQDADLTLLIEELKHSNPEYRPTATECVERLQRIADKPARRRVRRTLTTVVAALVFVATMVFWLNHRRVEQRQTLTLAFTSEAKDIEWLMRLAHSLPLQGLELRHKDVLRRMGSMRGRMQTGSGLGRGAGYFALGRSYLALGEVEKAREHLAVAWAEPYRHPEVAYAYALTRAAQHEDARAEQVFLGDPEWREYRERWMDEQFRRTALEYLSTINVRGAGTPDLTEALIAMLEHRRSDAREALRVAKERSPWLYETDAWNAELDLELAYEHQRDGLRSGAWRALERAADHFAASLQVGSSDPRLHLSLCRLWNTALAWSVLEETEASGLGEPDWGPAILSDWADSACDNAETIDPHLSGLVLEKARTAGWLAVERADDEDLKLGSRLLSSTLTGMPEPSEGRSAAALRWHSWAFAALADMERRSGKDPLDLLLDSLGYADRAAVVDPEDPAGMWLQAEALRRLARHQRDVGESPLPFLDRLEDTLRGAIRRDREFAGAYLDLARTYEARARWERATGSDPEASLGAGRTAAAKALNLQPENQRAAETLATLEALIDEIRAGSEESESLPEEREEP